MDALDLVDELYAAFAASLPRALAKEALDLSLTLQLAPSRGVPWSRVFGHEVTLAAPALVAEAMPYVSPELVRDAVMAQAFAVIEAFGTDRIEDRQIEPSEALVDVLTRIRTARRRGSSSASRGSAVSAAARTAGAMRRSPTIASITRIPPRSGPRCARTSARTADRSHRRPRR